MEVNVEDMGKIYAFKRLQHLACPAHGIYLISKWTPLRHNFLFMVGDTVISQSKIQDILNISDNAMVASMSREERQLFYEYAR